MAGLAGLALAKISRQFPHACGGHNVHFDVCLTDGHPSAVFNNNVCVALANASRFSKLRKTKSNLRVSKLLWKSEQKGAEECLHLTKFGKQPFQLCLVSDCVHFQEFHGALLATIGRLLSVGGMAVLAQPERADSLGNFIEFINRVNRNGMGGRGEEKEEGEEGKLESEGEVVGVGEGEGEVVGESNLFEVELREEYSPTITKLHKENLAKEEREKGGIYDPTIHYPKMLILTKLRGWDEVRDGDVCRAFKCKKQRR